VGEYSHISLENLRQVAARAALSVELTEAVVERLLADPAAPVPGDVVAYLNQAVQTDEAALALVRSDAIAYCPPSVVRHFEESVRLNRLALACRASGEAAVPIGGYVQLCRRVLAETRHEIDARPP
jgi:hypothetical protein